MDISWVKVTSSNIDAVSHDEETNTLTVKFHSGAIWNYKPITRVGYMQFLNAESKGKYFNENIKKNDNITAINYS